MASIIYSHNEGPRLNSNVLEKGPWHLKGPEHFLAHKAVVKGPPSTYYETYLEKKYFMEINMNWGFLPKFVLFLPLGDGELSGMDPGKLSNWTCFSRPSGLPTESLHSAASGLGLQFSPEWITPTSACEKGIVLESQDS